MRSMTVPKDAFRRFQEELAALDREKAHSGAPESPENLQARARAEFLMLRERYRLTVADVVAFFPEEEGIAYLQQLIAAAEGKPARRPRKRKAGE